MSRPTIHRKVVVGNMKGMVGWSELYQLEGDQGAACQIKEGFILFCDSSYQIFLLNEIILVR